MTQTHSVNAPDELELIAYADGRLDAGSARGREIEAWLQKHACARQRVREYRLQDSEIRQHFAPSFSAPLPAHMRPHAIRNRRRIHGLSWMPAAAVAVVAALALSWSVHLDTGSADLEVFAQGVVHQLDTAGSRNIGQSGRSGTSVLSFIPSGFEPAGERQLDSPNGPLTEHVYRDDHGRNLRVFIGDEPRDKISELQWLRSGDRAIVYWKNGSRMFALSGDVTETELREVAARALLETESDSILAGGVKENPDSGQAGAEIPASRLDRHSEATVNLPEHEGLLTVPENLETPVNGEQTQTN